MTPHLVTLGGTRLLPDPGAAGPGLVPQGKALALLTYLHCAPRRSAPRDHLIDLLWRSGESSARQSLRQVVYRLRNALGEHALDAEGDVLALRIPLTCDRDQFLAKLHAGDHAAAIEVYAGPFFPGFAAPGAVGFEQWVDLERAHLRAGLLRAAEAGVGAALARGEALHAVALAARTLDHAPDAQIAWRLLIQAQVASGRHHEAGHTADRLEAWLTAEGDAQEGDTRRLLATLRRQPGPAAPEPVARRQPDLLGRESVFASLLAAWHASATGKGQVVAIQGAAGIGKSRLLEDFRQRLAALGASVLSVRTRPAERDIPYSLMAHLAEALAGLPGSPGVSPSTAGVLVDLAPGLSNRFHHTAGPARDPGELLRVRSFALHELVQVTADDAPVVILVDDLHWADEASRQVLNALAGRVADHPVLLVVCFRPMRPAWSPPEGALQIELEPLSAEDCGAMVASIAAGEPDLCAALGQLVHQSAGGVPLLALAALDLALERGVLRLEDGQWAADEPEALRSLLTDGNVVERLLGSLSAEARDLLLALAVAGQGLDAEVLGAAVAIADPGPVVDALELRGLLLRVGPRWEVAHDRLAEAAAAIASPGAEQLVARRAGHALLQRQDLGVAGLRLGGRLLLLAGDPAAGAAFRRWLANSAERRLWRDPDAAAREFLGERAEPGAIRALTRQVSPADRIIRGWPLQVGTAAALLVLGTLGATGDRLLTLTDPKAQGIRIIEPPSSRGFLFDSTSTGPGIVRSQIRNPIPLAVSFLDAEGRPTRRGPASVEVHLITQDTVMLEGRVVRPARWGRAEFEDLVARGAGSFQLEVRAGSLPPARSGRFYAGADLGGAIPRLQLLSGRINGQQILPDGPTIRVSPGATLAGEVTLHALTTARTAAMLLGAVALWGDRTSNFIPLHALPPHGETRATVRLRDPNTWRPLQAPGQPGRYALLFVLDAETEMRYIASWTNWITGRPEWRDGNDLADLSPDELETIRREGGLLREKVYPIVGEPDNRRRVNHRLVAAVLEVIVE